jgi:ATP-dependent Zn protease
MNLSQQRWFAEQRRVFDRMRSAPRESDQRRRERAAYHEAAHAVLAHMADMPIIKVEITPTGNKRTGCLFTRVDHAELCQRHGAVTTLAMLYSGAVSERRRFGNTQLADDDFADIGRIVVEVSGRQRSELLDRAPFITKDDFER